MTAALDTPHGTPLVRPEPYTCSLPVRDTISHSLNAPYPFSLFFSLSLSLHFESQPMSCSHSLSSGSGMRYRGEEEG